MAFGEMNKMSYFHNMSIFIRSSFLAIVFFWIFGVNHSGLAQGGCSSIDLNYTYQNTEFVQRIASTYGLDCLSEGEKCLMPFTEVQMDLTSSCFGEQVACIVSHCHFICAFGTEAASAECPLASCEAGFNECARIIDKDKGTWTNFCVCDAYSSANCTLLISRYDS
tara:strand:+ start:550 stop:1047 length:498 start_codon:yes stop_codon:yes gene_type:complete